MLGLLISYRKTFCIVCILASVQLVLRLVFINKQSQTTSYRDYTHTILCSTLFTGTDYIHVLIAVFVQILSYLGLAVSSVVKASMCRTYHWKKTSRHVLCKFSSLFAIHTSLFHVTTNKNSWASRFWGHHLVVLWHITCIQH